MDVREVPREPFRRHPWEVARCRFFRATLEAADLLRGTALDVGAGDAFVAEELTRAAGGRLRITCWDAAYGDSVSAEASSLVEKTRERPAGRFDLLLLLDVLEHVEDDHGFLSSLVAGSLDGHALISVPAWPALFGPHDEGLGHHRRYTPATLAALVQRAGLVPIAGGGLYHTLLPVRALLNVAARVREGGRPRAAPPALVWRHGELSARLVESVLRADAALGRAAGRAGLRLPGLTEWLLCRRA